MSKYKAPKHLEHMGARYEYVQRPESAVELRHGTDYVITNYEAASVAFPVSGDNLILMKNQQPRWRLPQPEHLKKKGRVV